MRHTREIGWLLLLWTMFPTSAGAADRPNVLMIPVDDLADYVSILQNHPGIQTPNFDRLAKRSVVFTRAFAAAPLCQPSRAAVSCGMFPHRTGIYSLSDSLSDSPVALKAVSLVEQFKRHGYDTYLTGKYYHGKPKSWWPADRIDAMWTEKLPPFSDHGPYLQSGEVIAKKGIYAVGPAPGGMESMPDVKSLAHTRRWLREKHDKPFLIVQGINKPHLSFVAPQQFFDLYPLDEVRLPETVEDDLADVPAAALTIFSRKDRLQFQRIRDYKDGLGWKMTMQAYMASISFSDWVLGEILDALEASPYADNTIVVLWSDHGYHIGEKEKLHKQTLWSQACHVPFVIRLPKETNEGTRCTAPVSLLDIYPTLNELCDLTQAVPQSLDGHSLVPLIEDSETEWPHLAISSHGPKNVAVSDARYRYIRYADGSDELYDHEADPREFTNLAGLPKAEPVKQRLAKSLPDNVIDEVKGSRHSGIRNEPGLVASSATALSDAESNRPNIVFFLSDDQGYADAGFNGSTEIKTPNLDRLAENGTILTSLYAQPVCSPTRAALMTGRYPTSTGVYQVMNAKNTWRLKPDERTLAKALHDAGYETAICGKWHLGHEPGNRPTDQGFDHQYGFMSGAIDSFKLTSGRGDGEPGRDWYRNDQRCDDQGYATELIADEACRIIETKDPARPLFLYVPFGAVHTPHQAPDRYTAAYRGLPRPRKNLAAMTTAMDEAVERIVNALIEKGIRDNTLIIFCSDNGGVSWGASASNAPLRGGKADIYEGGVRVCAFANWPGKIPAGVKNDQPMHVIDWYPTLIKLAGESIDQPLAIDGKDIWTVLTEDAQSPHEEILIVGSVGGQRAIRMGDWKLLINPWDREKEGKGRGSSGRVELYDLSHDIGETTNLVDQHPDRAKQMRARLEDQLTTPVNPAGFYSLRELQALKTETLK